MDTGVGCTAKQKLQHHSPAQNEIHEFLLLQVCFLSPCRLENYPRKSTLAFINLFTGNWAVTLCALLVGSRNCAAQRGEAVAAIRARCSCIRVACAFVSRFTWQQQPPHDSNSTHQSRVVQKQKICQGNRISTGFFFRKKK